MEGGKWQPLLAVHLIVLLASAAVLTPLSGLIVRSVVAFSGQEALSDTEIASFLLSPGGAVAGMLLGALLLTFAIWGYAALLVPVYAIQTGGRASLAATLARVLACAPSLFRLSLRVMIRYLLIFLPFAAVIGLTYWLLLSGYDINYYLAEKPPEFFAALAIAGVVLVLLGVILIQVTISWFYALPLVLFAHESAKQAKRHSVELSCGQRKSIALCLALWLFGTPVLNMLLTAPLNWLVGWWVPQLADRLPMLALVLGGGLLLNGLLSFVLGFVALSLLAHRNIEMFRDLDLGETLPVVDQAEQNAGHQRVRIPLGDKLLLVLGLLVVMLAGVLCYRWVNTIELKDDVLVIAHRGSSLEAPENTMAAIRSAVEAGSDWVEIDVQETADGKVVVFHDSDFKRVGSNPLTIWDARSEQLPGIDIGSWFDPTFASETTPSLREVLQLCRDKSGVLIELKYYGHDKQLEQRVIDIVEQESMQDQVMVMSLSYPAVQKVRKLRPEWKVGLLSTVAIGDITSLDVDFLGLNSRAATKRLIDRAHRNGIDIFVWTVNDPIDISTMTSRGVDGLITDAPARAFSVLEQRKELNPSERLMLELAHIFGRRSKAIEQ